jgi:glutathione S-transferase kappa 1
MEGKIELFFDCVSPYSWFAFDYLLRNREALKSHDVAIEYGTNQFLLFGCRY